MIGGFLNPLLAFGAALALVPLLIHLLNRQRYRPMRWAAMRFVLAAYRRTRRRVELENLLLLLLRMGAIAFLALAVARPFTSDESPLAALTESRRDLLLALDASASTGYREEGDQQSVFDRILARSRALVGKLEADRGDRVSLVIAGAHPRSFSWMSPDKALSVLSSASTPTDEALDLAALLGQLLDTVKEDAAGADQSSIEVRFLTDLQRTSFGERELTTVDQETPATAEEAPPLASELLDALAGFGVRLFVEDHGPGALVPPNLGIGSVEPVGAIAGPGQPFEVAVRVENYGDAPRAQIRVALELDGERLPSQKIDLSAHARAEVLFPLQVPESGAHALVAVLEGDRLTIDDQRPSVVVVPPPLRVLVVNGAAAARIADDEIGYLMAVLEPPEEGAIGAGLAAGFDPRAISPDELSSPETDLTAWEVIVLANVSASHLGPKVVEQLERAVARGTGLVLSVGDRVAGEDARFPWNDKLYRPDGSGLLPAELLRHVTVTGRRGGYFRVAEFDAAHPVLSFFADDLWRPLLTEAPVYEFVACQPLADAKVLARLDDEEKSPLLVERPYDQGRVYLWTSTLDRAWTFLPDSPHSFIPLVHELIRQAGSRRAADRNLAPGETIALEVPTVPRSPLLVRPEAEARRPVEGDPTETVSGRWRLPLIGGEDTARVGIHLVEMEGAPAEPFAVQLEPREGDLARLSANELTGMHPSIVYTAPGEDEPGGRETQPGGRGELWRWLALATLVAIVGESLWAAWLGAKRRVV